MGQSVRHHGRCLLLPTTSYNHCANSIRWSAEFCCCTRFIYQLTNRSMYHVIDICNVLVTVKSQRNFGLGYVLYSLMSWGIWNKSKWFQIYSVSDGRNRASKLQTLHFYSFNFSEIEINFSELRFHYSITFWRFCLSVASLEMHFMIRSIHQFRTLCIYKDRFRLNDWYAFDVFWVLVLRRKTID